MTQEIRTRVWYFVIADCDHVLANSLFLDNRLTYEITMTNSDKTHFSAEDSNMTHWFFAEFLVFIIFFGINITRFYKFYKTQEQWDMPFLILNIAIYGEAVSVLTQWLHLLIYQMNGYGNIFLDLLS